jgi:uncharacterized protein YegP (UPF0339 family)
MIDRKEFVMFEVFRSDKDGKYYFRLKAQNGETVLSSQAYTAKRGCMRGIKSVKKNAADSSRFVEMPSADGRFFFVLRAANFQVIGTSQIYSTASGVRAGIESVMQNAPGSEVRVLVSE